VCRGWINLCWGFQGGEAHLASLGRAERPLPVQMWLATLRNLPYFSIADMAFSVGAARRAMGKYVVLRFARARDTDAGMENAAIASGRK